jgi:PAS domain S-box-containing protein
MRPFAVAYMVYDPFNFSCIYFWLDQNLRELYLFDKMPAFALNHIVDFHPLTVSSQITLKDLISQLALSSHDYVLVMDCQIPRSILTAKDLLKLISQNPEYWQMAIADLLPPLKAQVIDSDLDSPHNVLALFHQYHLDHVPVVNFDGDFVGIITEQKVLRSLFTDSGYSQSAETALQESEARLQDIIDNASAVIYLKDLQGRYILINRRFQILFHVIREEVLGKTDLDIFPKDLADILWGHDQQVITDELPKEFEESISQGAETKTFLSIKFPLHNAKGDLYAVCGISTDISDRKKSEQLIATSLQEKEVLLKEIHHRVKNNMHVISNLLDLQSQYIDDHSIIDLFTDSQYRINTMALIHEQLYQSPSLGAISFDVYLENLVHNLFASYNCNPGCVQLQLDLEPVTLNIETAMPCGLIVNELVSNSLKYAFPQKRSGILRLHFYTHPESEKHHKDRRFVLVVGDNGVGIRNDINWQSTNSLGLRLVRMLTRQLDGVMELDLEEGTLFRMTFSELQYRERL